jgi:hypothetical protein
LPTASTAGQLLQVERAGIPPLTADPERIAAVLDADKQVAAADDDWPHVRREVRLPTVLRESQ